MSKESDERTTPIVFFEVLDSVFHFELDAAATKENTLCDKYWTMEDNGLLQPWEKSTWCNPPYSRGEIIRWTPKARYEYLAHNNNSVLILPGDISTAWFYYTHEVCSAMYAKKGRLKFNGNTNLAKFGTLITIFGYTDKETTELTSKIEGSWLKL